jgi:hypothetical protein
MRARRTQLIADIARDETRVKGSKAFTTVAKARRKELKQRAKLAFRPGEDREIEKLTERLKKAKRERKMLKLGIASNRMRIDDINEALGEEVTF